MRKREDCSWNFAHKLAELLRDKGDPGLSVVLLPACDDHMAGGGRFTALEHESGGLGTAIIYKFKLVIFVHRSNAYVSHISSISCCLDARQAEEHTKILHGDDLVAQLRILPLETMSPT